MKKSKFIQSSKDMLHRSFNPAKCKTALRLAGSRLKLMRNKKELQVKQMKREIAQLLESGQDRTARIRVDHIVREEKMMAAYDLLEIYCELIVARLPIIESQKNIPTDLKEALASVIFASPRCGDVPELLDIRKHLTAKYGKDFTTAAIELRPDSGVGRMLVEKLSAVAPDGQTKIKILSAIAEEHSVNWDPNSIDEKDSVPSSDLLTGQNNFGKASADFAGTPHIEVSDIQSSPRTSKLHDSSWNVSQQDHRTSLGIENFSSTNSGVSIIQQTSRLSGDNKMHLSRKDSFTSSLGGDSWNMEFKDATSAAQAAAESAERASIAARAAAELSNRERIMRQNSKESHNSDSHILKDRNETYGTSKLTSELFKGNPANSTSLEGSRLPKEQIDRTKANDEKASGSFKERQDDEKKYVPSTSSKSKKSQDNVVIHHDVPTVGAHSQTSSKVSRAEISLQKESPPSEVESINYWTEKSENFKEERIQGQPSVKSSHDDTKKYVSSSLKSKTPRDYESLDLEVPDEDSNSQKNSSRLPTSEISMKKSFNSEVDSSDCWPEKSENFSQEMIRKQPSVKMSRSNSSISDDINIFAESNDQNCGHDAVDRGNIHGETMQTSYHESTGVVFDRSDSDSNNQVLDFGTKVDETELVFNLPSQSPEHLSIKTDYWNTRSSSRKMEELNSPSRFSSRKASFPDLSENLISRDGSEELNNFGPVKFDYSDGPSSESDKEVIGSSPTVMEDSKGVLDKRSSSRGSNGWDIKETKFSGINSEQSPLSSDDESKSTEVLRGRNQGKLGSPEKFRLGKSSADWPTSRPNELQIESDEFDNKVSPGPGEGLNFGKLTGGFRHKGYTRPPYLKNQSGKISSLKKETGDISISSIKPNSSPVESPKERAKIIHNKTTGAPLHSDTDTENSEEQESSLRSSAQRREHFIRSAGDQDKTKTGSKAPNSVFDPDNSDLVENVPKEYYTKKGHFKSGISRRTKASSSSSQPSYQMNTHRGMLETFDSDKSIERESTVSNISEVSRQSESQIKNSLKWESHERPNSAKTAFFPESSSLWASPEQLIKEEATHVKKHQSKTGLKHGAPDHDAGKEMQPGYSKRRESKAPDSPDQLTVEEATHVKEHQSKTGLKHGTPDHDAGNEIQPGYSKRRESKAPDSHVTNDRKPSISDSTDAPRKFEFRTENSGGGEKHKRPTSPEETFKPTKPSIWAPPDKPKFASEPSHLSKLETAELPKAEKSTSMGPHESKVSLKSSVSEPPSSPQKKTKASSTSENPKATSLNKTHSNKVDNPQKAGHVHPKLPDYDSLVQAFRKNRP